MSNENFPKPPSRLALPSVEAMNEQQRDIYDRAVAFFGAPTGPRMVFIETPEVGAAWSNLATVLTSSELPRNLWELTILTVARQWGSQFEWHAHEQRALDAGLSSAVVEAIRLGRTPIFEGEAEAAVHDYVTELYANRSISQPVYDRLKTLIGQRQLVELTVLIGHYTNVAITLIAHEVALPGDVEPRLPPLRG